MPFGFHPTYLVVVVMFAGIIAAIWFVAVQLSRPRRLMSSVPLLSGDGQWWWDGATWHPTTSEDGRWRWDGRTWQPLEERATRA